MSRRLLTAAFLVLSAGLAAGQDDDATEAYPGLISTRGFTVLYQTRGPLSYVTMTVKELPKGAKLGEQVYGRGCQYALTIPLAAALNARSISGAIGAGGYDKAMTEIKASHPDIAGIFDVKVDVQSLTILSLYQRLCTEVRARAFRLPA